MTGINFVKKYVTLLSIIFLMLSVAGTAFSSESQNQKKLVLLPLKSGGLTDIERQVFQNALKEGLSENYKIYSGEQVKSKLKKIAIEACTTDECLEQIAIAFNGNLIGRGFLEKDESGYIFALEVKDVFSDQDIFNSSEACSGCSKNSVIKKIKLMAGKVSKGETPVSRHSEIEKYSSIHSNNYADEKYGITKPPKKKNIKLKHGILEITSEPSGATVFLDNRKIGVTPFKSRRIKEGIYGVTLKHRGFKAQENNRILVENGEITSLHLILEPTAVSGVYNPTKKSGTGVQYYPKKRAVRKPRNNRKPPVW